MGLEIDGSIDNKGYKRPTLKKAAQDSPARPVLVPGACHTCYDPEPMPEGTEG